ncbi:MAG: hypothetical protein GXY53_05860, partial [Desulfobulbus sp.]|nr:hypothetical protein [Desulfobulbus sp.]
EEVRNGTATYYGSVTPDAGTKPGLIDLPDDVRPAGAASPRPTLDDGGIIPDRMKDSDGDGMPDWWEEANKLNPLDTTDGNSTSLSGTAYTNLEVYMNSLVAEIQNDTQ